MDPRIKFTRSIPKGSKFITNDGNIFVAEQCGLGDYILVMDYYFKSDDIKYKWKEDGYHVFEGVRGQKYQLCELSW